MPLDLPTTIKTLMNDRMRLIGYVHSIVRDRHVAEDVFQDVVTLAVEKYAELEDSGHLLAWARGVAKNKARESLRRRKRSPIQLEGDVLDLLEGSWADLEPQRLDSDLDYLRACLESLSPRMRRLIDLKYVDGLSGAQIAERVETEVHSVYVSLTRAYRRLAQCVDRKRAGAEFGHA